jgi:hypothetical protein
MRSRWLLVVLVASLCLNVAVIGAYLVHRRSHDRLRRFPSRRFAPELREKLRQTRAAATPGFAALADSAETADSLLWVEMRNDNPDSVRVDSFCQELGRIHGVMRAMVFRQMHHEIQLMPAAARAEYLTHMMRMKPAMPLRGHRFGRPGRGRAPHMRRGRMAPEDEEPMPEEPSPGPSAETGD